MFLCLPAGDILRGPSRDWPDAMSAEVRSPKATVSVDTNGIDYTVQTDTNGQYKVAYNASDGPATSP